MKALLRPLVLRLRMARQRLALKLRPPLAWDGMHDPIVARFGSWHGVADGIHRYDFLGARTNPDVRRAFRPDPAGTVEGPPPGPSPTYFELLFVLRAVAAAAGRDQPFVMAELGAGYGPWLVTAAAALRRLGHAPPPSLIGVEMEPRHFEWMRRHLADNGLDPDDHRLLHGAIDGRPGRVSFTPDPDPDIEYGLRIGGQPDGQGVIDVRAYTLEQVIEGHERVDLMHVDIQGQEWPALRERGPLLRERVGRILIATHSRGIHRRIRRLFADGGWRVEFDFGFRTRVRTSHGDQWFLDGMLAVVNLELERDAPSAEGA